MATEKTCFKCSSVKPLSELYRHAEMADGHLNKCKACTRQDSTNNRAKNLELARQYDRDRASLPHRVALRAMTAARWRVEHPDRRRANVAVGNAVRDGRLARQLCVVCGDKAEAHHPDYSRPLDVVWLCQAHHKQAHAIAD